MGAPPDAPWQLPLEFVEAQLQRRFPGARIFRHTFLSGEPYLSFTVGLPDGVPRTGIYAQDGNLVLRDGTPADWADTFSWFLGLLGAQSKVLVMAGDGPEPTPLPDSVTTPEQLRALFERLELT